MDIAALSMALSQMNVRQEASVLVTKKAKDEVETNGASVVKMLEQSVQPHIGGSIDIKG
ncbi:YjfB family protein [Planococcus plakortidis]|uniref:YjfB family protein n=1 Tax=Planococcus plakortidis TaxID=1038856 RepID=UPI00385F4FD0